MSTMDDPTSRQSLEPGRPLLADRVALITAGASGMGRAAALSFAAHGAHVVVVDIDEAAARATTETIRERGGSAEFERADLTSEDSIHATLAAVGSRHDRLDVLFNHAGAPAAGGLEFSAADWDRCMALNLRAPMVVTQAALPLLRNSVLEVVPAAHDDVEPAALRRRAQRERVAVARRRAVDDRPAAGTLEERELGGRQRDVVEEIVVGQAVGVPAQFGGVLERHRPVVAIAAAAHQRPHVADHVLVHERRTGLLGVHRARYRDDPSGGLTARAHGPRSLRGFAGLSLTTSLFLGIRWYTIAAYLSRPRPQPCATAA
jgi:hypothetical protein